MPISQITSASIATNTITSDDMSSTAQYYGFKNRIINGAMGIWQRGTTLSAVPTGTYLADRWQCTLAGTSLNLTMSQDTSVPNINYLYSLKFQQLSNNATSVSEYAARQRFELANVRDLAGSAVTVSFWYRSNVTGTHGVRIIPLGTTGGVDSTVAITVNAANTWEYKTVTTTALSAITSWGSTADNGLALILDIGFVVNAQATKTINTNDYFNVTGVQLEKGSVATSFDFRPYGTELMLCQRYCIAFGGNGLYEPLGMGVEISSTGASIQLGLPVSMRGGMSITTANISNMRISDGIAFAVITSLNLDQQGASQVMLSAGVASGLSAGRACRLISDFSTAPRIFVTSEL